VDRVGGKREDWNVLVVFSNTQPTRDDESGPLPALGDLACFRSAQFSKRPGE
jgi:hypothetical protein